jgi:hypothetical protein
VSGIAAQVAELRRLVANWNSYNARPIDEAALQEAARIGEALQGDVLLVPLASGGVSLELTRRPITIDVSAAPGGFVYTALAYEREASGADLVAALIEVGAEWAAEQLGGRGSVYVVEGDRRPTALGPALRVQIERWDGKPMSWREVWEAFAERYPDRWAVQVFPPGSHLIDQANKYHLYILDGEAPAGLDLGAPAPAGTRSP